jgi:hypothetical protein
MIVGGNITQMARSPALEQSTACALAGDVLCTARGIAVALTYRTSLQVFALNLEERDYIWQAKRARVPTRHVLSVLRQQGKIQNHVIEQSF